jgi:hypothetical protein
VKPLISICAFAAFLAILGAAVIVVGIHDSTIGSAGVGLTALSALLLVVGVVLLVAAYRLVRLTRRSTWTDDRRPRCKPIVLVAFVLTIVLGIYVFFAAIGTSGAQRIVVVVGALAFIVAGLLGLRFFGRDARITPLRVEGAIALGVIGIVVGVGQFWFQNQYVPSHAGRAVALKVALSRAGERDDYDVIRARVDYAGIGGKSVSVIGSAYTLTGSHVVRCHRLATVARVQDVFEHFLVDPQTSRFMTDVWEERPSTVLAAGKFVADGKRLDPNVPSGREFIFFVRRHRYQLLRFRAQLFAIPASVRLSQRAEPEYANFRGDNELYGFWEVVDDSWLHDLIYGRARWVVLRYELVDPDNKSTPEVSTALRATARFPNPTWGETRPGGALVNRLFAQPQPSDSSEPFADTELSLERVAEPSALDPPSCRRGR